MIRAAMILILSALASPAGMATIPQQPEAHWWEQSIWERPDREYQWYPPDPPPKRKEPEKKPAPRQAQPKRDIRSLKTVKEIREELERLRDIAVMSPTPENVRAYLEANKYVMDKSAVFADVARRVVWATPEVDYSLRRPVVTAGVHVMRDLKESARRGAIAEVMRTHGVFFFLRSDCPYCHEQAKALAFLERFYGLEVFPVTLDGGGLPEYPNPRPDNGIARLLGVTTVPALYLMAKTPKPGDAPMPIGHGLLSAEEIVGRIYTLTRTQPGDEF
ncbi:MAG: conjugal transfer protein TraF [Dehalococcoidia bacterium]|nr:conjugal transfer protein TraF [Dehalococcoidia bacterium]